MSDVINLTITEQVEVINLTMTEENPINISFYQVAIPDARVGQALQNALAAQAAAETAAAQAAQAGQQAVEDAFSSKTTDDLTEGAVNLYFTPDRAKGAAVINSTTGSESDQAPSVSAFKDYVQNAVEMASNSLSGTFNLGGSWRMIVEGSDLKIQKLTDSTWVTISEFNS